MAQLVVPLYVGFLHLFSGALDKAIQALEQEDVDNIKGWTDN